LYSTGQGAVKVRHATSRPEGYFLLLLQKKVTKEKETGKDNLALFVRPLHRPLRATKQGEVRTFSGLPAHNLAILLNK